MPNRCWMLLALSAGLGIAGSSAPVLAQTDGTYSVSLYWTAPVDDGGVGGRALLYDVRWANRPISDANFEDANRGLIFLASPPGTPESCRLSGMLPGSDYYFAVKTMDANGNWSNVSNVAHRSGREVATEPIEAEFSIGSAQPNPARNSVQFGVTPPRRGEVVRLEAFDAAGRRVRSLMVDGFSPARRLSWDLHDDRGAPVPAGVYILRAQHGTSTYLRRFIVVR